MHWILFLIGICAILNSSNSSNGMSLFSIEWEPGVIVTSYFSVSPDGIIIFDLSSIRGSLMLSSLSNENDFSSNEGR